MIREESACVCCPPERGCMGQACPNRRMTVFSCNSCGEECEREDLRVIGGRHMCKGCYVEAAMELAGNAAESEWQDKPCL